MSAPKSYSEASRMALLRRVHIAEALLRAEKEHTESLLRWGQKAFEEVRRLERRCTFLYETALHNGVGAELLRAEVPDDH